MTTVPVAEQIALELSGTKQLTSPLLSGFAVAVDEIFTVPGA